MKSATRSNFATALILLAVNASIHAEEATSVRLRSGQLQCGDALVSAEAKCFNFPENQTQCTSQTIRLNNEKKGISKLLPHDGKPITQSFVKDGPVLDSYVVSWACLTSTTGKSYPLLFYFCVESEQRPECLGTNREWGRLFDTNGNHLTAGYRRNTPKFDRLMNKLGLGSYQRDGIQLRSISESSAKTVPQETQP